MQADLTKTLNMTDVYYQGGRIGHIIFDIKPVVPNERESLLSESVPIEYQYIKQEGILSEKKPKLRDSEGAE